MELQLHEDGVAVLLLRPSVASKGGLPWAPSSPWMVLPTKMSLLFLLLHQLPSYASVETTVTSSRALHLEESSVA